MAPATSTKPTGSSASGRKGDPTVAVLLSWFLPGAGHLYLGRAAAGVTALLLVEGLYALGWFLSEGRSFEFLDPELRGPMATLLTPEFGNLGALIAQLRVVGYGPAELRPFPETVSLGVMLTSVSGIAGFFVMAHAHLEARAVRDAARRGPHPTALVAAAWALPGLGHFLQGRRLRGAIVFVLLVGFFLLGTLLAEGTNLSRERHFYFWSGQMLLGLPAIGAELLWGDSAVTGEIPRMDVGLLYACMPGLLNILAMLDVHRSAEGEWLGLEEETAPGSEAVAEPTEARGVSGGLPGGVETSPEVAP